MVQLNKAASWQRFGGSVLAAMYRVRVHNLELMPASGPVIVAANHSGLIDGPMLLTLRSRPISVMAKHELFHGFVGALLKAGEAIPVDWKHADRSALHEAKARLEQDQAIAIFPEGTRCRGQFDWIRGGISYLAAHTGAAIVPVAITGTRLTGKPKSWIPAPGSEINLVVGEAFRPVTEISRDQQTKIGSLHRISREIQSKLQAHVRASTERLGVEMPSDDVSDPLERVL